MRAQPLRCLIAEGHETDRRLRAALLALRRDRGTPWYGSAPARLVEQTASLEEIADCWRKADHETSGGEAPAARRVRMLLEEAAAARASDIVFENDGGMCRVHGIVNDRKLALVEPLPADEGREAMGFLFHCKDEGSAQTSYQRGAFQGFSVRAGGQVPLPATVSALRCQRGPHEPDGDHLFARLFYRDRIAKGTTLESLGFSPEEAAVFSEIRMSLRGGIFLGGTAGDGKSTTLATNLALQMEGLVLLLWAAGGYFIPVIETVSPPEQWSEGARLFRSVSTWLHANPLTFGGTLAGLAAITAAAMVAWTGPGRTQLDRIAPFSLYRTITGSAFLFVVMEFLAAGIDVNDRAFEALKRPASPYARHRIASIQGFMAQGAMRLLRLSEDRFHGPSAAGTALCFLVCLVMVSFPSWLSAGGESLFGESTAASASLGHDGRDADYDALLGAVLTIVGWVGLLAFLRGVFVLRAAADGVPGAGASRAFMHMLGGICAWHIAGLIEAVQTSLGIQVLRIT